MLALFSRTRMVLEPYTTSLGGLGVRSLRLAILEGLGAGGLSDDGVRVWVGGSAARTESGSSAGRGSRGDHEKVSGFSSFGVETVFLSAASLRFLVLFESLCLLLSLFFDNLACDLRRSSLSLRFCFVAASCLVCISHILDEYK